MCRESGLATMDESRQKLCRNDATRVVKGRLILARCLRLAVHETAALQLLPVRSHMNADDQDSASIHTCPAGDHSCAVTLVAQAQQPAPHLHDIRPQAAFVTQIIASMGHMGPYRRYQRAEPAVAMKSYAACKAAAPGTRLAIRA
jgi:hypothetical protein